MEEPERQTKRTSWGKQVAFAVGMVVVVLLVLHNSRLTSERFGVPLFKVMPPSSAIDYMGYDADRELLAIVFVGREGEVYYYRKVPRPVFVALAESDSPGRYFNEAIRDRYKHFSVPL